VLAVVLLLVGERAVFAWPRVWAAASEQFFFGLATTRLDLLKLSMAPADRPHVLAIGSSRVFEGINPVRARRLRRGLAWSVAASPRFDPFVLRSLTGDMVDTGADAVVFVWSEFDTNRPVRLEPLPGSSAAGFGAIADLVRFTGARFAIDNRESLYRLAASTVLQTYRFRTAFERAGLTELSTPPLDERLRPVRAFPRIFGEIALYDATPTPLSAPAREALLRAFGDQGNPKDVDISIEFVAEIQPGRHAVFQRAMLRRAAELLRRDGVEVIVLEGPLHPLAAKLYDAKGLGRRFRAFARELEEELGVHVVTLDEMPPFAPTDFKDLIHLQGAGTLKLTRAAVDAVVSALGLPSQPPPAPPAPPS
jgi:hypothetical protein